MSNFKYLTLCQENWLEFPSMEAYESNIFKLILFKIVH